MIASLPPEDATPKPCPKCGRLVPVKARNRPRHILTIAGELRFSRNYHHCGGCNIGFYPRDRELKLPEKGEVSDAMEKRILDFGVNDTFEEAAERWSIHYPRPISSNLVRRVVDRVGERQDAAWSELSLQQAYRPTPGELPRSLVVASDGVRCALQRLHPPGHASAPNSAKTLTGSLEPTSRPPHSHYPNPIPSHDAALRVSAPRLFALSTAHCSAKKRTWMNSRRRPMGAPSQVQRNRLLLQVRCGRNHLRSTGDGESDGSSSARLSQLVETSLELARPSVAASTMPPKWITIR